MAQLNFVFIVADDLGHADLGCYGGRDARFGPVSPQLDLLAAAGLRFTQGYANSPVCSPTRFALMTASYQYRLRGAAKEPLNSKARGPVAHGLPPSHPTLCSLLRTGGYRTALIGKWHLGFPPNYGPLRSGYEEFFGPLSGGIDYFTHCDSSGRHDLWRDGQAHSPLHWRMNHRGQRALRNGRWKYLRVDDNDYLFDIETDERERANLSHKHPQRMQSMRDAWESWNQSMPPIPDDATVSLGYSSRDMPQR